MPVRYNHWIAGKHTSPHGGRYLDMFDPRTRQPAGEVARGCALDIDVAVREAIAAQAEWASRSTAERASVLYHIADAIDAHAPALVELERACTGKIQGQAQSEIEMSAAYFRYYAGAIRAFNGRTIDQGSASHTYTRLEPYGVVGVITPWNYPLNQVSRAAAPAIAVGNAVVAKPSEYTSTSTLQLAQIATEAGLPAGLFNVVTGLGEETGRALAVHPAVRKIAFTGSVKSAQRLAAVAAQRLIPLTLELGGKSPLVIFADADLDRAALAAVAALARNAGQVCSATMRLLVEKVVHDEVVARVVEGAERLRPGVDFGPMITETQYHKVIDCFAQARRAGLEPRTGGAAFESGAAAQGWYVRPTVYAGVSSTMPIARDEIFGPVLVVMPFCSEAEAIAMANDTEYGLAASIWSGDLPRALRTAHQIAAGQIAVNGGPLSVEAPFGGFKLSGYGREKGLEALHEYAQVKAISISLA